MRGGEREGGGGERLEVKERGVRGLRMRGVLEVVDLRGVEGMLEDLRGCIEGVDQRGVRGGVTGVDGVYEGVRGCVEGRGYYRELAICLVEST